MNLVSKIALGALASVLLGGTAMAADLMQPPPPEAAMTSSADWTGLYLGVGGDYRFRPGHDIGELNGIIGANFQTGMFLVGLQGWVGYSYDASIPASFWEGGIEGRAGFVADSALLYGSLGYEAYDAGNAYYQAGVGVEFMVSDSMGIDVHYKHSWGANNPIVADEVGASLLWHFH